MKYDNKFKNTKRGSSNQKGFQIKVKENTFNPSDMFSGQKGPQALLAQW